MQLKYHLVTIEDFVPEGHFLRKLEALLDLSFVYEETAGKRRKKRVKQVKKEPAQKPQKGKPYRPGRGPHEALRETGGPTISGT